MYSIELKYFRKAYQITIVKDTVNLHYKMEHHDSPSRYSPQWHGGPSEAPPSAAASSVEPAC